MKIARFSIAEGVRFGVLNEETGRYHLLNGDPLYSGFAQSGQVLAPAEAKFVAPVLPRSKVLGFLQELSAVQVAEATQAAQSPDFAAAAPALTTYLKPNTAVIGVDVPVVIPQWAPHKQVQVTPELGLVISRPCKDVPENMVSEVIFGYVLVVSVNVPSLVEKDCARAFAFDTSCPLGPILETGLPSGEFAFTFDVGEKGYDGALEIPTAALAQRVALASQISTLLPGDIVLSGPLGASLSAKAGEEIIFEHNQLGKLRNPVLE